MTGMTLLLLLGAMCFGIAAWFIFLYAMRSGQWKDIEQIKYQLFEDQEEQS